MVPGYKPGSESSKSCGRSQEADASSSPTAMLISGEMAEKINTSYNNVPVNGLNGLGGCMSVLLSEFIAKQ